MSEHCPEGHENGEGAAYCSTCGAPLAAQAAPKAHAKWLLPLLVGAVIVVVGAVVAILAIVAGGAIAQAEKDAAAEASARAATEAAQLRLARLSSAVESCGLSASFVTQGGRKFEVKTGFSGNATSDDVDCVLVALGAPDDVIHLQAYAGRPPSSAGWDDFTFTIDYPAFLADSIKTIEMHGG